MVSFKFPPANPRCHGNEFSDKIGYNSAPVKDNCALFAHTPTFLGPGYLMMPFKFLSWRPLLPWQRILGQNNYNYNSACVRDMCKIFASIVVFSGMGHRMLPTKFFPERPSLPWQQIWDIMGWNSAYVRDISDGCFQDRFILVWAVCNYSKVHICTPAKIIR